jgi:hypothetical protein
MNPSVIGAPYGGKATKISNLTFYELQVEYTTNLGQAKFVSIPGKGSVEIPRFRPTETTLNLVEARLIELVDIMR